MIMAGYEYRGKMPFKHVYFTGIVRDKLGRKMKSCGVGSKKRVVNEPIIVEGTHEAIISKEDFELAQKLSLIHISALPTTKSAL